MAHSQTVENYLKAIFQAQSALEDGAGLVQMGHLAASIGVVPGTATTMVKALAEAGLALYEPYAGVRLTPAGEKLAALVLRRHRLIEAFLVEVMGMSWTEVHDEAEHLEHAASDRLVERMDEMLGRPDADPHGDPIPDAHGAVPRLAYESLLTCAVDVPVTVARVTDQDRGFLEFAERHGLRPGDVVLVEDRDAAGDSVRLRNRESRHVTIGTRAASKVLVRAVALLLATLAVVSPAFAQAPASRTPPAAEPFQITDNSFLVEEAFNQETGIFQNIFSAARIGGAWAGSFTQEWPVGSQAHQFSYTLTAQEGDPRVGFGDTLLNYRYQASVEGPGRVAFSPRLSAVLPTGRVEKGLGDGTPGLQVNLPVSKQFGDWYIHGNAGLTWLPRARTASSPSDDAGARVNLVSPFIAGSAIYRVLPMLNLMLESLVSFDAAAVEGRAQRSTTVTLSPGFRGGWNFGDRQVVVGLAAPIAWTAGAASPGALLYFSYELPFSR